MSSSPTNGAETVVSTILEIEPRTRVFAVPGGPIGPLIDAFASRGVPISFMAHEQSCAMACDGFYRVSGQLPVLLVTNGPGVTNTLTGVSGAYLDSVPMLVISGAVSSSYSGYQSPRRRLRQYGVQDLDSESLVASSVKHYSFVEDYAAIETSVRRAAEIARGGRPGPTWLEIPIDVQNARVPGTASFLEGELGPRYEESRIPALSGKEGFGDLISDLMHSQRPLMILGGGLSDPKSRERVQGLITDIGIPTVSTWGAVDILAWNHPLNFGNFGNLGQRAANTLIQSADLIVSVGSRLSVPSIGYISREFAPLAKKWIVDIDPFEMEKPTLAGFSRLEYEAQAFLKGLAETIRGTDKTTIREWLGVCRKTLNDLSIEQEEILKEPGFVDVYRFSSLLAAAVGSRSVNISVDMGLACTAFVQSFKFNGKSRLVRANGLSAMGYSLPAAIGSALVDSQKISLCVSGDGALQMNIQELQTLKYLDLPVKVFCLDSDGMLAIEAMQQNQFESRYLGSRMEGGYSTPDFESVGVAYGIRSTTVTSEGELIQFLESREFSDSSPLLISIKISHSQRHRPRVINYRGRDGQMQSGTLDRMWPSPSGP